MKKLTCHCKNVELEVNIPEAGFPKFPSKDIKSVIFLTTPSSTGVVDA